MGQPSQLIPNSQQPFVIAAVTMVTNPTLLDVIWFAGQTNAHVSWILLYCFMVPLPFVPGTFWRGFFFFLRY